MSCKCSSLTSTIAIVGLVVFSVAALGYFGASDNSVVKKHLAKLKPKPEAPPKQPHVEPTSASYLKAKGAMLEYFAKLLDVPENPRCDFTLNYVQDAEDGSKGHVEKQLREDGHPCPKKPVGLSDLHQVYKLLIKAVPDALKHPMLLTVDGKQCLAAKDYTPSLWDDSTTNWTVHRLRHYNDLPDKEREDAYAAISKSFEELESDLRSRHWRHFNIDRRWKNMKEWWHKGDDESKKDQPKEAELEKAEMKKEAELEKAPIEQAQKEKVEQKPK